MKECVCVTRKELTEMTSYLDFKAMACWMLVVAQNLELHLAYLIHTRHI